MVWQLQYGVGSRQTNRDEYYDGSTIAMPMPSSVATERAYASISPSVVPSTAFSFISRMQTFGASDTWKKEYSEPDVEILPSSTTY